MVIMRRFFNYMCGLSFSNYIAISKSALWRLWREIRGDTAPSSKCKKKQKRFCRQRRLYFTLTTKGCLAQQCTSTILCHTSPRAVPLVYPGEFSSSSLIPMVHGSHGGTVWEQTGAPHNGLPVAVEGLSLKSCGVAVHVQEDTGQSWRFQSLVYQPFPASFSQAVENKIFGYS